MSCHYRSATGHGVGPSESQPWKQSLLEMAEVLSDEEIPSDADFVITGQDAAARTKLIIVELKQWSDSRRSEKDAIA